VKRYVAVVAALALQFAPARAPAAAPAPSPAALLRFPKAVPFALGGTKYLVENEADAAVSGVQIFVDAGLNRETSATSGVAALVAECVVRTPAGAAGAAPLKDAVAAQGGSLSYTVDGRSVHYYLEARSEKLSTLVTLFGKALAAPDFSQSTIAAGRASLGNRIADLEQNALSVAIQMFRRSFYSSAAGGAALGSATTLAALSSRDMSAFHTTNYTRGAISASAVGRLAPDLGEALAAVVRALPDGAPKPVAQTAKRIPAIAPRIVAHRDVSAPWVVVGFAAPSPASADFGAMHVLQPLLADAFERSSATTPGFVEKAVGAFYLYDSAPASVVVYVNGTQMDPAVALRELLAVSHSLSLKPLGAEPLRRFKATAEGQFVTDSLNISDRSYLLGAFSAQGLGPDSINAALAALERTTPADVQRVAKTYLQRYIVALVLPRQSAGQ